MKQTNLDVWYQGKHYVRASDLAHDTGLSISTIKTRWTNGVRDVKKLTAKRLSNISENTGKPIKIVYKGIEYSSLAEFARSNGLVYNKLLKLTHRGVWDSDKLAKLAKPVDKSQLIKELGKENKSYADEFIHSQGLLTIADVVQQTGITRQHLTEIANRTLKGGNNYFGIEKSDIIRLADRDKAKKDMNLVNNQTLSNFAFKAETITHIREHQSRKNDLVTIPFKNTKYYYDFKNRTVWSTIQGEKYLKQLTPSKAGVYRLHWAKGFEEYTAKMIEDLIAYPKITGDMLLSLEEITRKLGFSKSTWYRKEYNKAIGPYHTRYTSRGKKVIGWTRKEVFKMTVEIKKENCKKALEDL